jgi:glycerol-3-phosphate acyltransferase PlsY
MTATVPAVLVVVASYLLGSVPSGYLFARARGIDIRAQGSGNIGATNVARSLGKKLGLIVLLVDLFKGALPVLAVRFFALHHSAGPYLIPVCGFAAIIGHCFPIWLRLRGGKGVATAFGVFLAVDPLIAGVLLVIFLAIYAAFRVASLGSLLAALSLPVWLIVADYPVPIITLGVASAALIVVKHRSNILRLMRGAELKV